jgi:hypothetical protein
MQIQNEYDKQPNSDNAGVQYDDDGTIIAANQPHLNVTHVERAALARQLDPADSPVWQAHLD